MNSRRQLDIARRITKIQQPVGNNTPSEIIEEGARRVPLFKKLVGGSPDEIIQKVCFLIINAHNEDDWQITCKAAESLFIQTKDIRIVNSLLEAAYNEKDADSLGSIFYLIKKVVILTWGTTEIPEVIIKHAFTGEKQQYLAISLSEALKISRDIPDWVLSLINSCTKAFKAHFLSNLLLDRNMHLHFEIEKYSCLYKLDGECTELLINDVKGKVTKPVMKNIVSYLLPLISSISSLWVYLEIDVLIRRINEFTTDTIIKALIHYQLNTDVIDKIISELHPKNILEIAVVYTNKEYKLPQEQKIFQKIVNRVISDPNGMYTADKYMGILVLLSISTEIISKVSMISDLNEEIRMFIRTVLSIPEDESACEETGERLLMKYVDMACNGSIPDSKVVNLAVCHGIHIINEAYSEDDLMRLLKTSERKEIIRLLLKLLQDKSDSVVLNKCWEHSNIRCTSINTKEHTIKIEEIIEFSEEVTERDELIRSVYICSILSTLPVLLQKKVLMSINLSKSLWSIIINDYRKYEPYVLAGLTNSTSMWQGISCSKPEYLSQDISCVQGDITLFLILHIIDTNYPIHYVQIIDRMKILHSSLPNETVSKWAYNKSTRTLTYKGTSAHIRPEVMPNEIDDLLSKDTECIRSSIIYEIVQEYMYTLLKRDSFREYVVHALIGDFLEMNEKLRIHLETLPDKPRKVQMILNNYTKKSITIPVHSPCEKRHSDPHAHTLNKKQRKVPIITLTPEQEEAALNEELKRTGILAAQLAVSKTANAHTENDCDSENHTAQNKNGLQIKVFTALQKYTQEQINTSATYFCKELERYWIKDREKISSHFDAVVRIIHLFSKADGIDRLIPIISGYLNTSYIIDPSALDTLKDITTAVFKKYSTKRACTLLNNSFTDCRVLEVYTFALKTLPSGRIETILKSQEPSNLLHQAAVRVIIARRDDPVYKLALNQALTQLHSRNDNVLNTALTLLKEEYINNPNSDISSEIIDNSVRLLRMRTKLDSAGVIALEIIRSAVFNNNYVLDHNSKEELISSIKYDLYNYKDILTYFINEVPSNEFLEIISHVNSPTSKSIRSTIKQIIMEYTPPSDIGHVIFSRLIDQAKEGTVSDKLFIINLLREVLEKYSQGAWLTVFIKVCELIGNECRESVVEGLLLLLRDIIEKSQAKKRIKNICREWRDNPKLKDLVEKVRSVLK
ncbi:hypothetical protein NEPAR04_1236 [Nematocida parisii]|nr:hypothetical protein NEPAR03_0081 [Nematocida parisii]KAI5125530.1 hypothetical protein NEPAR08_0081 [Nematocida parisii]KAI5141849.1 hypothetical protein NEPAR04_1236 [Nematocida parisii]